MPLSQMNVMPSMRGTVAYRSLVTVHGMMMVPAAESVQCVAGDGVKTRSTRSVPTRIRSEPMAVSIIFVSLSGGDNSELQRILRTFLTCVPVVLQFLYSFGFVILLNQRTLLAVG